jgi:hypothetical protein
MKKIVLLVMLAVTATIVFAQQKIKNKDLKILKERMEGFFNSHEQSVNDSSYFDIHLHMKQIWETRKDGYWLYVEQAVASALKKPYRQRIYHVYKQDDSTLVSKVYEMPNSLRFAGAYKDEKLAAGIAFDSLIDRQGCAIYLHKNKDGNYYGSTPGKECLSNLRGAMYATSEVVIYKDKLISWDRGWDKNDKQVWGAVKGGYNFIKQKDGE